MKERTRRGHDDQASTHRGQERLWQGLRAANVPSLLLVVAQLSNDRRWLRAPYVPARTRGMDDNDSGGLPDDIQDEIRRAAFELLTGPDVARAQQVPAADLVTEMISASMGEAVPAEYARMMLEEMQLQPRHPEWSSTPDPDRLAKFSVAVIGAGVSGICAAIELHRANIPCVVLERSPEVGGTWFENTYPGCGVDTPSHLYSFSFAPHNWSRYFAKQQEIHDYLEQVVDTFEVRDLIRFDTAVLAAEYDTAQRHWRVRTRDALGREDVQTFNAVISAVGQLNEPLVPAIPGAERFTGVQMHSARWPADLDVTGRRVIVIGSGATAMQVVPSVVERAAHVTVFQRSPQWAAPSTNYQRNVPDGVRLLMNACPLYAAWYRARLVWSYSDKVHSSLQIDPQWPARSGSINAVNDGHRRYFTRHIVDQLADRPDLVEKVVPEYPPFAKRMLIDNNWVATLKRPDVELVDTGIHEITEHGCVDGDGVQHEADVIVYATGFNTLRMLGSYDVRGAAGTSLRDVWGDDDARAYLGITVRDFPNFFCLYGPNTGLGHGGSLIFLTECATRYVVGLLQSMIVRDIAAVDVKQAVFEEYNKRVDSAHEHMVWAHPQTTNWYRNTKGRVVTNSPWRVVDYWQMTHDADLDDYDIDHTSDVVPVALSASRTRRD